MRAESHHDRGGGIQSVLALIGAWDAVLGLRFQRTKPVCVRGGRSSGCLPQFPAAVQGTNHAMERKKCWAADTLCRLDHCLTPQYDSELDLGSPEALIPRDEESSEEDRPFLPRFLLQEIVFAHSP